MSPSQLPDDVVSVVEEVTNLDRMVSSFAVVTRGFLLVIVRPKYLLLFLVVVLTKKSDNSATTFSQPTPSLLRNTNTQCSEE